MSSKSFSRAIRKDCTASGSKGLWGSSERTGSLICMQKLNMLFPLLPTKPTAPQLKPHGGPSRNWASRLGLFIDLQKAPDAAPAVLTVCTFMPISRQTIRRPILGRSTTLPHIYLGKKNFVAAKALAERAIKLADSLKAPEARDIK